MNRVYHKAEEVPLPAWIKEADFFIGKVLDFLEIDNWELSVVYCDNKFIKTLNEKYLNRNEATDVLSFPNGEIAKHRGRIPAGDIVISLDALEENSHFFKVPKNEEFARLLVHGILHLTGADHRTNRKEEPMLLKQEEILLKLGNAGVPDL